MKKSMFIAAVLAFVAVGAFAEYKLFIQKKAEPENENIPVILSENRYMDEISAENRLVVDSPAELKHEYNGISAGEKDTDYVASELLLALEQIDKLKTCDIRSNKDISIESNGNSYYRVTDRNFGSTDDVKKFMSMYLTDSLAEERYSGVTTGSDACLKDGGDGLYVRNKSESVSGLNFTKRPDGSIVYTVSYTMPDGFTLSVSGISVEIICDSDLWKINSIG